VDAGLSCREMMKRLQAAGEDASKVRAILITHEHSDHIAGLVRTAKVLDVPVFVTGLTAPLIDWKGYEPKLELFQAGASFCVGDIDIDSFTIPHDAIDPVGFCFRAQGLKIGVATDLGYIPDSIRFHLRGTDILLLESNHDVEMLKVGPYPWSVKQRVMGRRGHLSNDVVSQFIQEDLDSRTQTLILGHLSEHNNHPELARLSAQQALDQRSMSSELVVANQRAATAGFTY
jgi:phosphoribosyl 1,2-cyclic phosphodiesterase